MHYYYIFILISVIYANPINYNFADTVAKSEKFLIESNNDVDRDDSSEIIDDIPNTLNGPFNISLWQLAPPRENDTILRLAVDEEEEMWKSPLWMSDEVEEWQILPKNPQTPSKYLKLFVIVLSIILLATISGIVLCVIFDNPDKEDYYAYDDEEFEELEVEKLKKIEVILEE